MNLLVDPVVLSVPHNTHDAEDCLQFVEHLSDWSDEVMCQRHEFFIAQSCLLALYDSDLYPTVRRLNSLWNTAGVSVVDHRTAYRACERILRNVPHFEERVELAEDLPVHTEDVYVDPDLVGRLDEHVARALRRALGYVAYAREESKHPIAVELLLITHPIEGGEEASIKALVDGLDLATGVPLVQTPSDLRELVGLQGLWQDTGQAITWAVEYLVRKHCLQACSSLAPYTVRPEFNQSIRDNHYDTRNDQLRQIFLKTARLLAGEIPHKETERHHRLRTGGRPREVRTPYPGKPWEAWRLQITSGNLAIRLHYWWNDGRYCLSKVGPHEDYSIGSAPSIEDFT